MSKKSFFIIMMTIIMALVVSLTLVPTVSPKINAAKKYSRLILKYEDDFIIDDGVLIDLSDSAKETIRQNVKYDYVPIEVQIPTSVTKIGPKSLKFSIPNYGGDDAYIDRVIIPDSVKIISSNAISSPYISEIKIPASVEEIGEYAFRNCTSLERIYIREGVQNIGPRAFAGINGYWIKSIYISLPDSLISIGEEAFCGDSKLKFFHLPKNVQVIGDRAFKNCSGLERFYIPSNVVEIGENVFEGCTNLNVILVENRKMLNHSNLRVYQEQGILHAARYSVTFDTNGGNDIPVKDVAYGTAVGNVAEPTKQGYQFAGWYLNGEEFNIYGTHVIDDITLTAQWEKVSTQSSNEVMNGSNANENVPVAAGITGGISAITSSIAMIVRAVSRKRLG